MLDLQDIGNTLNATWSTNVSQIRRVQRIRFEGFASLPQSVVVVRHQAGGIGLSADWVKENRHLVAATIGISKQPPVAEIPHIHVSDVRRALHVLAIKARERTSARSFAVIGSVGKTSTTNMLAHVLRHKAKNTNIAIFGSGNTPLYLAVDLISASPTADFHVYEMAGASRQGLRPLAEASAELMRPNVGLFTALAPAHMDQMLTLENAAYRKAAAFNYLAPGGTAVINRDINHYDTVSGRVPRAAQLITFGSHPMADIRLLRYVAEKKHICVSICGETAEFSLGVTGDHFVSNSLGVVASLVAEGISWQPLLPAFTSWRPLKGRGREFSITHERGSSLVIDDAYNANPASMQVALRSLKARKTRGRRIAVLGEMKELGSQSEEYHLDLKRHLEGKEIDKVYFIGGAFHSLFSSLKSTQTVHFARYWDEIEQELISTLLDGDILLLKGSNGTGIHKLADKLEKKAM
ncbi:UDP-N-acetylmuramoyl-tripeptide--D-alanyl-D-alanine ligase [Brucellaceae bacterium D45D]